MIRCLHFALLLSLLAACSSSRRNSEWDSIDYSRIKSHYGENDSYYTPPAGGCLDDDLHMCR